MARLIVFNSVTLDGFFTDSKNDMSFAYTAPPDAEWNEFVSGNAQGGGILVFGRITYEMMVAWWPTPAAMEALPAVARGMNEMEKIVFSRTLAKAEWSNTRLVKTDPVAEIRRLKKGSGKDMVILGSGTIVSAVTAAGLVDEIQLVVIPIVLGRGKTLFPTVNEMLRMTLSSSRAFKNGNVVLCYTPRV